MQKTQFSFESEHSKLFTQINLEGDEFWENKLELIKNNSIPPLSIHLAILSNYYLQLLLTGEKTIESRFSVNRIIPYGKVNEGDIILLKKSGGNVMGISYVSDVWFYEIKEETLEEIQNNFSDELRIDDSGFWEQRKNAAFATLIRLKHVKNIDPFPYVKRDRRAWIVLHPRPNQIT